MEQYLNFTNNYHVPKKTIVRNELPKKREFNFLKPNNHTLPQKLTASMRLYYHDRLLPKIYNETLDTDITLGEIRPTQNTETQKINIILQANVFPKLRSISEQKTTKNERDFTDKVIPANRKDTSKTPIQIPMEQFVFNKQISYRLNQQSKSSDRIKSQNNLPSQMISERGHTLSCLPNKKLDKIINFGRQQKLKSQISQLVKIVNFQRENNKISLQNFQQHNISIKVRDLNPLDIANDAILLLNQSTPQTSSLHKQIKRYNQIMNSFTPDPLKSINLYSQLLSFIKTSLYSEPIVDEMQAYFLRLELTNDDFYSIKNSILGGLRGIDSHQQLLEAFQQMEIWRFYLIKPPQFIATFSSGEYYQRVCLLLFTKLIKSLEYLARLKKDGLQKEQILSKILGGLHPYLFGNYRIPPTCRLNKDSPQLTQEYDQDILVPLISSHFTSSLSQCLSYISVGQYLGNDIERRVESRMNENIKTRRIKQQYYIQQSYKIYRNLDNNFNFYILQMWLELSNTKDFQIINNWDVRALIQTQRLQDTPNQEQEVPLDQLRQSNCLFLIQYDSIFEEKINFLFQDSNLND